MFPSEVYGSLSYIATLGKNNCQTESNIAHYLSDRHNSETKNSETKKKSVKVVKKKQK